MYQSGTHEQGNQRRARAFDDGQHGQRPGGGNGERGIQQRNEHPLNVAELAIRGTTMLFDIQMAALRSIWQVQARSAVALGAPDCSELLRQADSGAKQLLSTGAEQLLESARQANDAIAEMQSQFGRIVEQGAQQLTEEIRNGIEELSQRTQQGLLAVKEITEQSADEGQRIMQHARRAHGGDGDHAGRGRQGGFESTQRNGERGAVAGREQAQASTRGGDANDEAASAVRSRSPRSRATQKRSTRQQQSGRRGARSSARH